MYLRSIHQRERQLRAVTLDGLCCDVPRRCRMRRSSERRLEALEASYQELLLPALRRCARGQWGLFGQNDAALDRRNPKLRARLHDPAIKDLLELGAEIDRLRQKLGYFQPFALHDRLVRMRSLHDSNTVGELKLAQQWLDEMPA
jgi:hypothetical protein